MTEMLKVGDVVYWVAGCHGEYVVCEWEVISNDYSRDGWFFAKSLNTGAKKQFHVSEVFPTRREALENEIRVLFDGIAKLQGMIDETEE